jgi:hypothetical protein
MNILMVYENVHRGFASSPQTLNETTHHIIKKPEMLVSTGVQKRDLFLIPTKSELFPSYGSVT